MGDEKLRLDARERTEEVRCVDEPLLHIDADWAEAVLRREVDGVVAGVAADIEDRTAAEALERHVRLDVRDLIEGAIGKRRDALELSGRHAVREHDQGVPGRPLSEMRPEFAGRHACLDAKGE
jgi:hypothetical protein